MEHMIVLEWKPFPIKVDRLGKALKGILSSNFDGLVCGPDSLQIMFKEAVTQEDADAVTTYWDGVTEITFSPSLREMISARLNEATVFGQTMILDFAVENVEMGITQAQKTKAVSDYCRGIQRYLQTGSLYAAVEAIQEMITAGVPAELAPFVTEARLITYRDRLNAYLGL